MSIKEKVLTDRCCGCSAEGVDLRWKVIARLYVYAVHVERFDAIRLDVTVSGAQPQT